MDKEQDKGRDIKKDVEYIFTQLDYLKKYDKKIADEVRQIKSLSKYWSGFREDEPIYQEIARWLKCYESLRNHISSKSFSENEIHELIDDLTELSFDKPSTTKEDELKGMARFAYYAVPGVRLIKNKKKIKGVVNQHKNYQNKLKLLNTLAFKIEAYYFDDI